MSARGTRLPDFWEPTEADRDYARKAGFGERDIDTMAINFRDHFTTATGYRAMHRLWDRVWHRWVRTEAERKGVRPRVSADVLPLLRQVHPPVPQRPEPTPEQREARARQLAEVSRSLAAGPMHPRDIVKLQQGRG